MTGVQLLILPYKCNQSLIWKGRKKCNKSVIFNQPPQEIFAHLEHLHAPTADWHLRHKEMEIAPGRNCSGCKMTAGSVTSGGRDLPIVEL